VKAIHIILQSETEFNSESGMSLVAVIVITTLFTSLVLVMATQQWANSNMNAIVASEQKSYYVAEAGIEFAIRRSMDLDTWSWTYNGAFGGGNVAINVSQLGGDSVQIVSTGQVGTSAKSNRQVINVVNFADYSVFIEGSTSGWFWSDASRRETGVSVDEMPIMNLDSMRTVSQNQGRYHGSDYTITSGSTPWTFWNNPGDHSQDANIIWVEGDLEITWSNFLSQGIFVVMGDVKISGWGLFNGIIYCPNPTTQSLVRTTIFSVTILSGAVVGNTDIYGNFLALLTVSYNSSFVNKFYTYALNSDNLKIERLSWASIY